MVYITGAGPGDPGLLTIKARQVLGEADVIIYDRLAGKECLSFVKKGCRMVYVGKESTEGGSSQQEINRLLVEYGRQGGTVVRLKGGDPFLFGRGGEECLALIDAGVPYQVIPGVSSALAVPAYAGIPVTHRGVADALHIFTGHSRQDDEHLDFSRLALLEGTKVILMGMGHLERIVREMILHGADPATPVACVSQGTTPLQKMAQGTLATIVDEVAALGLSSPAVIVIGRVAALSRELAWRDSPALLHRRILLTGSSVHSGALVAGLEEAGAEVIEFPMIRTDSSILLDLAACDFGKYNGIIFASPSSVRHFFEKIKDLRSLLPLKIACVGSATAALLAEYKFPADFIPEVFTIDALFALLAAHYPAGAHFLYPTSQLSPVEPEDVMANYQIDIHKMELYQTEEIVHSRAEWERLSGRPVDYVVAMSGSAVRFFCAALLENTNLTPDNIPFVSIGPSTSAVLRSLGCDPVCEAEYATSEGIITALINHEAQIKN